MFIILLTTLSVSYADRSVCLNPWLITDSFRDCRKQYNKCMKSYRKHVAEGKIKCANSTRSYCEEIWERDICQKEESSSSSSSSSFVDLSSSEAKIQAQKCYEGSDDFTLDQRMKECDLASEIYCSSDSIHSAELWCKLISASKIGIAKGQNKKLEEKNKKLEEKIVELENSGCSTIKNTSSLWLALLGFIGLIRRKENNPV